MHGSIESYEGRARVARIVLRNPYSMNREKPTLMTDVRAWLFRLGVTVIECVFLGCDAAAVPAVVPFRTRHLSAIHDPCR